MPQIVSNPLAEIAGLNSGRGWLSLHAGIEQLLLSLEQLEQGHLKDREDDVAFLKDMLKTPEFQSLLKVINQSSSFVNHLKG